MLLDPHRVLPQAEQKAKIGIMSVIHPTFSSQGQGRASKVSLALWVLVAMQDGQGHCGS